MRPVAFTTKAPDVACALISASRVAVSLGPSHGRDNRTARDRTIRKRAEPALAKHRSSEVASVSAAAHGLAETA